MEVVYYTTNKTSYVCKKAHTSSNSILPTNTTYWTVLAAPGTDGTNGTNGTNGQDATQYYMHFVYCDDTSSGTNYSTTESRKYVGIYTDTTQADAATFDTAKAKSGIVWSKAEGEDGNDGTSVTISSKAVTYQAGTSGITAPTGTWTDAVPSVEKGLYLWTKTEVTYSDGTSTTSYSVGYAGTNGTSPWTVTCSEPSLTLACGAEKTVTSEKSITIKFNAFQGTSRKAATIKTSTLPSGVTVTSNTAATTSADGSLVLKIASGANLGGTTAAYNTVIITLTVTANSVAYTFSLTLSKQVSGQWQSAGWIDLTASTYNTNTWYPVTGTAMPKNPQKFQVSVRGDGQTNIPWSSHSTGKIGVEFCVEDVGIAWGWMPTNQCTIYSDYSKFTKEVSGVSGTPSPVSYTQLSNSSTPVIWLRGGAKYYVEATYNVTWTIRSEATTITEQTVTPSANTRPTPRGVFVRGKGISTVAEYYKLSASTTETFDSSTINSWSTSPSSLVPTPAKPYLLNAERITLTDGVSTTYEYKTPHICLTYQEDGADGRGITSITNVYKLTTNMTKPEAPAATDSVWTASATGSTSVWGTVCPTTTTTNKYLWNCERIEFDDGTYTVTPVALMSTHGATGAPGEDGTGFLRVTTAPTAYTTAQGGFTPAFRMSLSTVKTQSGVDNVGIGDIVVYSYNTYKIGYVDSSYVYLAAAVSIRGATGPSSADYKLCYSGGYTYCRGLSSANTYSNTAQPYINYNGVKETPKRENNYVRTWDNTTAANGKRASGFVAYIKATPADWVSGTAYIEGNIVTYNSSLYICHTAHTSSSSVVPTNTSYWIPANILNVYYNFSQKKWYSILTNTPLYYNNSESSYYSNQLIIIGKFRSTAATTRYIEEIAPENAVNVAAQLINSITYRGIVGTVTENYFNYQYIVDSSATVFTAKNTGTETCDIGTLVIVRGHDGSTNTGASDTNQKMAICNGYTWENVGTEGTGTTTTNDELMQKCQSMCLLGLAAIAKVYSANNVTLPKCCGTVIDLLIANIALIETLVNQQAFIQKLFVNQIKLMTQGQNVGAIYGGKYLADGTVDPNATTDKGVYMDALGEFKASNGQFSGNIQSENYFDAEGFTTYSNIRYNLICQKSGTGVTEQYTDKDYNFISTYINDSTYYIIVCECIIKDSSNNTIVSYDIGVSVPANHKIYASDTNETPSDSDYTRFLSYELPDKNFIWLKVTYNNEDGTLYKLTKKESAGYKLDENGNAKFMGAVIEASDFKLKTHAGDNIQLSYKIGEISNGSYLYELKPFGEGKLRLKFTIGDNVRYFGGQITINNEVISLSDQELNIQRDVSYKTNETIKIILSGIAGGAVSFGFILDSLDICLAKDSSMFKSFTNLNLINYQMFLSR